MNGTKVFAKSSSLTSNTRWHILLGTQYTTVQHVIVGDLLNTMILIIINFIDI